MRLVTVPNLDWAQLPEKGRFIAEVTLSGAGVLGGKGEYASNLARPC